MSTGRKKKQPEQLQEKTATFEGVNIEQPLPGGRIRIVIGEITISTSTPAKKKRRPNR